MKQFWNEYIKYNIPFFILGGIAVLLLIVAFILPPTAVIDKSVLEATGIIFAFAALWTVIIAIERGTSASIKKGDVEVKIHEEKEKE